MGRGETVAAGIVGGILPGGDEREYKGGTHGKSGKGYDAMVSGG
jgi:hypothetical protein